MLRALIWGQIATEDTKLRREENWIKRSLQCLELALFLLHLLKLLDAWDMRICMLSTLHRLICSSPGGWGNSKNKEISKNILGLMWENTTHARISSQWGADKYWRVYISRGTRTPGSSSHFHFLVRNAISSILSPGCAALTNSQK